MKPDPYILARPRPIRVAYLLEDGLDADAWLDAIFAECLSRHGGRQSLVVPVTDGVISKRYQAWLKTLDPDYVLAITYDNQALVPLLVSLLADTTIIDRSRVRGQASPYQDVETGKSGLTALSWLPFLKTVSGMHRSPPEFIVDQYPRWADDGFIKDNFGTPSRSLLPFPLHRQIGMRALMLTPEDAPADRWHCGIAEAEEVRDGYELAERMSQAAGVVTLGQLSNLFSQPHRPEHPWKNAFCIVVGDSFEDRVSAWNAALLYDDAQNQVFKTLRVPAGVKNDEVRTAQIAAFLRQRNWIGGNGGPPQISVRSHSLNAAELTEFVDRMRDHARSQVDFQAIASSDDCCPPDADRIWGRLAQGYPAAAPSEAAIRDASTIVSIPAPMQLAYCTGQHPVFSQGSWFVDLAIDRLNDNNRFANVRDQWRLPIRSQLLRMFIGNLSARILRRGEITVQVDIDKRTIEVRQPDDSEILIGVLNTVPQFPDNDLRRHGVVGVAYKDSAPSDKGRYLQGLIGMFGSLNEVEQILEKHFWRAQFHAMAVPARSQHAEVIEDLKKRMRARDGRLLIEDDAGWHKLAERVIQKSSRLRVPRLKTRFKKLLQAWQLELAAAIDADEQLHRDRDEILAGASDELQRSLGFLLEHEIFYRGHEWNCRRCSHTNWVGVGALADLLQCEVCRKSHQLPVDVALDFRLNEFFATCLREHDTLTVAWALSALRRQSSNCFIFGPQTSLFRDYAEDQGGRVDRELDVVCIVDGKLFIGEAKIGVELIASSDLQDLAAGARELGADVAILMALSGSRTLMDEKVLQLQALLPNTIAARGLVSDWDEAPSIYV